MLTAFTGSMIIVLLTALPVLIVFGFLNWYFVKDKRQDFKKSYFIHAAVSLVVSFLLVYGVAAAIASISLHPENVIARNWLLLTVIAILCGFFTVINYLSVTGKESGKTGGKYAIIRACTIGVIAVLFCEIFFFNYQSFVPAAMNLKPVDFNLSEAQLQGDISGQDVITVGRNGGSIILDQINAPSACFYIRTAGSVNPGNVCVDIMDDNLHMPFKIGNFPFFSYSQSTSTLSVYSSGNLKAVKFTFDPPCAGMSILSISMNRTDFSFSYARFLFLAAIVLLVILIKKKRLYRTWYDPKSKKHNIAIASLAVVLCMIAVPLSQMPGGASIKYPLEQPLENYGAYIQQFDAFQKGQLNLDLKVDPQLASMSNPYDRGLRGGTPVYWDRSFYGGKYYSYFGVAPIFAVYYPYYFLTGSVPADSTAGLILSLCVIPLIVLLVRQLACFFCKRINMLLLMLGTVAAVFVSLIYMAEASSDFYYIAYMSAILFFCLLLLFSFRAYRLAPGAKQNALLILAGGVFACMVGSRPTWAVYLCIVLPLFFKMLLNRNTGLKTKLAQAASFAVPAIIGVGLLLVYNTLRFDSPAEFGTTYQLTIANMKYGVLSPLNILPTIYFYFLSLPHVDAVFPFVHLVNPLDLGAYSTFGYKGAAPSLGALSFPLLWSIFFIKKTPSFRANKMNKAIFLTMLGAAFFLALSDYSASGTVIRYQLDIALVLALLAVILALDSDWVFAMPHDGKKAVYTLIVLAMCVSICVGAALIFENERNFLFTLMPGQYADLQKLFMFWL